MRQLNQIVNVLLMDTLFLCGYYLFIFMAKAVVKYKGQRINYSVHSITLVWRKDQLRLSAAKSEKA